MSGVSTSKCVFCTFARTARQIPASSRSFSSAPHRFNRKPKFPSVKPAKAKINKITPLNPEYLEKNFTPQQRAAIEAANKIVTNEKIKDTGKTTDPWSLTYVDDLTSVDPSIDHAVRQPWQNTDENSRLKTEDEFAQDLYKLMNDLPDDDEKAAAKWVEFDQNQRLTVGREEAERHPRSALAQELGKIDKGKVAPTSMYTLYPRGIKAKGAAAANETEMSPALLRLMQMTGLNYSQMMKLQVRTIVQRRVVNQTRLGKVSKMYFLSVAGNGNGLLGVGEGKAEEGLDAIMQSQYRAIRNMQPVLRYENRTIYGDVDAKVAATELQLYARPPGFGLRCQKYIFDVCRAAGITDLAARVTRARNPMNTVKATIQALRGQKDPEEIAKGRGKKLVDVRKVYYAGVV